MKIYTAPGHILQHSAIWEEVSKLPCGHFFDAGCGIGILSNFLLKKNWLGVGMDLNSSAIDLNKSINSRYINQEKYSCFNGAVDDFRDFSIEPRSYDMVISSNVIEHLQYKERSLFLHSCKELLKENGVLVIIVPGSSLDWSLEDEVVGHYMRYDRRDLEKIAVILDMQVKQIYGCTYPLSNILLPLANKIIEKQERKKIALEAIDRTIISSLRRVKYKTEYPGWFILIFNKIVLAPFIGLQKIYKYHPRSMALIGIFKNNR